MKPLHHDVAKVLIDPVTTLVPNKLQLNVLMPVCRVRVITVNGEMWENNLRLLD